MELAIPLIALGSMFIISKQGGGKDKDKDKGKENFEDGRSRLPAPAAINFPVTTPLTHDNSVNYYANPNQTTDKFLDPGNFTKIEQNNSPFNHGVGGSVQAGQSMTGKVLDKNNFKHNNMVPFFGGKIRGATADRDTAESALDHMQGAGSQQFAKSEQGPLFKPQAGMQYANGAPNMSDFMQSRVNPGMRMANVKPWEEQRVAPGLDQGFTTQGGTSGFNSGMEAREKWLPKTVNELRVETNPKMTFGLLGHEGPGDARVKNAPSQQTQGVVEKHLPEKFFASGPERWFTTTGGQTAPTARSTNLLPERNRLSTTTEYYGVQAGQQAATYTKSEYEEAKRQQLPVCDLPAPNAVGMHRAGETDHGHQSYQVIPNNRTTTRPDQNLGVVGGLVNAIMSPLLDIMRPSRKENVTNSLRASGNANSTVPRGTVFNPADRTKTTIKEMTEGRLDNTHLNLQTVINHSNAYLVSEQQPTNQHRDTTGRQHTGAAGPSGARSVGKSYEAEYKQHNNTNKTYENRPNQGGTQIFSQNMNICTDKRDCDRENNRLWVRGSPGGLGNPGILNSPSIQNYGQLQRSQTYDESINCERINPDILTAFKSNPYTQSLNSWA